MPGRGVEIPFIGVGQPVPAAAELGAQHILAGPQQRRSRHRCSSQHALVIGGDSRRPAASRPRCRSASFAACRPRPDRAVRARSSCRRPGRRARTSGAGASIGRTRSTFFTPLATTSPSDETLPPVKGLSLRAKSVRAAGLPVPETATAWITAARSSLPLKPIVPWPWVRSSIVSIGLPSRLVTIVAPVARIVSQCRWPLSGTGQGHPLEHRRLDR